MTIPSRWIFHQHTICRFIMVHSMTISPVWFVILQCLMFDIWRLTHIFLYLLIQDYIHPNHHVIICHWLFQFTEISRVFSLFFPSFPGILLVLEFRSQQKPPRNDACKFNPSWSGCVSRWWMDSMDSKTGGFSSSKAPWNYRQFVSNSTWVKDLRIKSTYVFLLFNHRSTWKLQTCWKQSEHFYHFLAELLFLWISQVSAAVTPTTSPSGHWCPETRPFWVEMTGRRWCPSVICVSALWFMTHLTS